MIDLKPFKTAAATGKMTADEFLALAICRAMNSTGENKREIALYFVWKQFFNHAGYTTYDLEAAKSRFSQYFVLGGTEHISFSELFGEGNIAEAINFNGILQSLSADLLERTYVYTIVDYNLPGIHKAVQSAHAAQCLGAMYPEWDFHRTHLILTEADPEDILMIAQEMNARNIPHAEFREPDLDNRLTAIAIGPLRWASKIRFALTNFSLMKV